MASVSFLTPPLGWRAERRFRRLGRLSSSPNQHRPSLSIIVPARNEERNLRRLLPSLRALDYDGELEIIVVDDNSTDQTTAIARTFGMSVISLEKLPPGWHGKPYACHMGAEAASGEWLLFTDADTIHAMNGPGRAISFVVENGLDGMSAFLKQEYRGLVDRMALQVAFAGLFSSLPDKHSTLNGQYILLRSDVYARIGGFASVRDDPLEDLALGHLLQRLGYHVPLLADDSLAQVAMYRDGTHLWRGMARIGAGTLRWSGLGSLITALFITALMTPLLAMALVAARLLDRRWILASWVAVVAGLWPWSEHFAGRWQLLFAPAGALFVQLATLWGLLNRFLGQGTKWKERTV